MNGVKILKPVEFTDERGYFSRIFRDREMDDYRVLEINRSYTKHKGTIRGLHGQRFPFEQDKLVQCVQGEIFDVAVDMRKDSESYGKWVGTKIDGNKLFLVPKGCLHGFQTLTDNVIVQYFVSEYYRPDYEWGARYDDAFFKIDWPIKNIITSAKDLSWPLL